MPLPRVVVVSNHAEVVGGGEISLLLLLEGLCRQGGWDLCLGVPGPGPVAERAAALDVEVVEIPLPRIRTRPWRLLATSRSLRSLIGRLEPALVHVDGSRAMLLAGRAAAVLGIPVVWHVRVEPRDAIDRWLSRSATAIVAPSEAVAARFPGRDVEVIPNPVAGPPDAEPGTEPLSRTTTPDGTRALEGSDVDPPATALAEAAVPAPSPARPSRETLLLVAARLSRDRGHERILDALARLPASTGWRLTIVGGPDPAEPGYAEGLRSRVAQMGWADRVEFLGFRDDVADLMRSVDLLIHAPDEEGFGRVCVEAMAVGLPVVLTPAGGLIEIHAATGYGFVAEDLTPGALARAIGEAIGDEAARARCRASGPELARSLYSVTAHAERVAELYRRLLGANRTTAEHFDLQTSSPSRGGE